jgi:hypothetical protein
LGKQKEKQKSRLAANFPTIVSKLRVSDARCFAKKKKKKKENPK